MFVSDRRFLIFTVVLFLIVIAADKTIACSCARNGAVDETFNKTANVVIVKVRSVERYSADEKGFGYGGIKQAKLTVEKVFKGNLGPGQELTFAQGGGADCIWTFNEDFVGVEYLFYLAAKPFKPGVWIASTCSRSASLRYAAADLLYLENLAKVKGRTRLSGTIVQDIDSPLEDQPGTDQPLEGRRVFVARNRKTIELKTDRNGVYEVYGLSPGKYKITPETIPGYKSGYEEHDGSTTVEIKSNAHTEQNFTFSINNAIAGRFFDTNGRPLKDVCLRLRVARGKESTHLFAMDCTDEKGVFNIDDVPAGTYVLVINEEGKITSDEPFGTFYYPAAKNRENAAEITIGPGQFVEDLVITAPETVEVVTVSGFVSLEDGKRANRSNTEYVSVQFVADEDKSEKNKLKDEDEDASVDARAEIDDRGHFTIRILKGQRGRLFASMMTYKGKYENCPKMDKLIRESGEQMPTIRSSETKINAVNDVSDLELKFPFPSCKLADIE